MVGIQRFPPIWQAVTVNVIHAIDLPEDQGGCPVVGTVGGAVHGLKHPGSVSLLLFSVISSKTR